MVVAFKPKTAASEPRRTVVCARLPATAGAKVAEKVTSPENPFRLFTVTKDWLELASLNDALVSTDSGRTNTEGGLRESWKLGSGASSLGK